VQKIAPIILLREKDTLLLGKRYFQHCRSKTSTLLKWLLICSIAAGLCCSVERKLGIIGNMGQRQDKTEIEYGDDCPAGWDIGKTPKFVYVRFSQIEKCPDPRLIPPNDRVFKLTQEEYAPCDWLYEDSIWRIAFQVAADPDFTWLWMTHHETGDEYFQETPAGLPDEGRIYHNSITACDVRHGAKNGIATVTWGLETLKVRGLLNIKTQKDLFMEMRPLANGNKVYKYCKLKDATNIKIKYEPD